MNKDLITLFLEHVQDNELFYIFENNSSEPWEFIKKNIKYDFLKNCLCIETNYDMRCFIDIQAITALRTLTRSERGLRKTNDEYLRF